MISKFIEIIPTIAGTASIIGAILFLVTLAAWLMIKKEPTLNDEQIRSKIIDFFTKIQKNKNLKPKDFEVSQNALDAYHKYGITWNDHITEILKSESENKRLEHERKENDALRRMVMSGLLCGIALVIFLLTRPNVTVECKQIRSYYESMDSYIATTLKNRKDSAVQNKNEKRLTSLETVEDMMKRRKDSIYTYYQKCNNQQPFDSKEVSKRKNFIDSLLNARDLPPLNLP